MKSSSKILVGVVVLLLVLAGITWKFILPGQEDKPEARIAAFIEALPGDLKAGSITLDSANNSMTISGLKGVVPYRGKSIALSVDSVTGQGPALKAKREPGKDDMLSNLRLTGLSATCVETGLNLKADTLLLDDLRADIAGYRGQKDEWAALGTLLDSLSAKRMQMDGLSGMGPTVAVIPVTPAGGADAREGSDTPGATNGTGAASASDMPDAAGKNRPSFSIKSLELANVNPKEYGTLKAQDLSVTLNGSSATTIAALRGDAVKPVPLFRAALRFTDGSTPADIYTALTGENAPLKALVLEKHIATVGAYKHTFDTFTFDFVDRSLAWTGSKGALAPYMGLSVEHAIPAGGISQISYAFGNPDSETFNIGKIYAHDVSALMIMKEDDETELLQESATKDFSITGIRVALSDVRKLVNELKILKKQSEEKSPQANATAADRGNPFALAEGGDPTDQDVMAFVTYLYRLASSVHVDQIASIDSTSKLSFPTEKFAITSSLKRLEYNDLSLQSWGPILAEGFALSVGDKASVSLERISGKSLVFPDLRPWLKTDPGYKPEPKDLMEAVDRQPFSLNGLTFSKLDAEVMGNKASLDTLSLDLQVGLKQFLWRQKIDKLLIPQQVYALLGDMASELAKVYAKPLRLDGTLDVEMRGEKGKGVITVRDASLGDPDLGSFAFSATLPFTGAGDLLWDILDGRVEYSLGAGSLRLEDVNVVETVVKILYEELKAKGKLPPDATLATLRQTIIDSLVKEIEDEYRGPELDKIRDGLVQLMTAPGVLQITLNPKTPVTLDDLLLQPAVTNLGAAVKYTPAKAK